MQSDFSVTSLWQRTTSTTIELTARYGDLRPQKGTDPTLVRAREVGGGLSKYFVKHALKVQADYFLAHG